MITTHQILLILLFCAVLAAILLTIAAFLDRRSGRDDG